MANKNDVRCEQAKKNQVDEVAIEKKTKLNREERKVKRYFIYGWRFSQLKREEKRQEVIVD